MCDCVDCVCIHTKRGKDKAEITYTSWGHGRFWRRQLLTSYRRSVECDHSLETQGPVSCGRITHLANWNMPLTFAFHILLHKIPKVCKT